MFLTHWFISRNTTETLLCGHGSERRKEYVFDLVRSVNHVQPMIDIEGGAGIPQVTLKPKLRPVLKRKVTEEDSGAGGEELEDADPFGMSHAK